MCRVFPVKASFQFAACPSPTLTCPESLCINQVWVLRRVRSEVRQRHGVENVHGRVRLLTAHSSSGRSGAPRPSERHIVPFFLD